MILKTYARIFTEDVDASLIVFKQLFGREPDMRFTSGPRELAAIGDILLVGGTEEALAPIRNISGPFIVDDLAQTQQMLEQAGAVITQPFTRTPNGAILCARHPDGNIAEYVEWLPELVKRIIG
jgi:predicted enzyme related to lactoylglutathione lyase